MQATPSAGEEVNPTTGYRIPDQKTRIQQSSILLVTFNRITVH